LAAIPAAKFSSSNPETSTVRTNVETPSRCATARIPSKNSSAPATTRTRPAARRRTLSPCGALGRQ
jgi:hypothetical protein